MEQNLPPTKKHYIIILKEDILFKKLFKKVLGEPKSAGKILYFTRRARIPQIKKNILILNQRKKLILTPYKVKKV